MSRLRKNMWISFVLGMVSLIAIVVAALALGDIYRGESDLMAEWTALRLCFAIILIFTVFTVLTLIQVLRAKG